MNIHIETPVKGNYVKVFKQFDLELLKSLTPPGMSLTVHRFDGSRAGDIIEITVKVLGIIPQHWKNRISKDYIEDDEACFVDKGVKLPWFLKYWEHRHIVKKDGDNCIIVDDITFRTPLRILDPIFYPIIWSQFKFRQPIYRKKFGER